MDADDFQVDGVDHVQLAIVLVNSGELIEAWRTFEHSTRVIHGSGGRYQVECALRALC